MLEIESKILEINKEAIIEALEKLEYKKKETKKLVSLLYDTKEDSIVQKGGIVRLRFDGEKGFLTTKLPMKNDNEGIKVFQEQEEEINFDEKVKEFENTHILQLKTEKERISYSFDNYKIEIDTYQGDLKYIPTFLEIEADCEETIVEIAKKLGYNENDLKKLNTFELMKHYLSTL